MMHASARMPPHYARSEGGLEHGRRRPFYTPHPTPPRSLQREQHRRLSSTYSPLERYFASLQLNPPPDQLAHQRHTPPLPPPQLHGHQLPSPGHPALHGKPHPPPPGNSIRSAPQGYPGTLRASLDGSMSMPEALASSQSHGQLHPAVGSKQESLSSIALPPASANPLGPIQHSVQPQPHVGSAPHSPHLTKTQFGERNVSPLAPGVPAGPPGSSRGSEHSKFSGAGSVAGSIHSGRSGHSHRSIPAGSVHSRQSIHSTHNVHFPVDVSMHSHPPLSAMGQTAVHPITQSGLATGPYSKGNQLLRVQNEIPEELSDSEDTASGSTSGYEEPPTPDNEGVYRHKDRLRGSRRHLNEYGHRRHHHKHHHHHHHPHHPNHRGRHRRGSRRRDRRRRRRHGIVGGKGRGDGWIWHDEYGAASDSSEDVKQISIGPFNICFFKMGGIDHHDRVIGPPGWGCAFFYGRHADLSREVSIGQERAFRAQLRRMEEQRRKEFFKAQQIPVKFR